METHGLRRAAEMEEAAKTLLDLGIEPVMTRGTVVAAARAAGKERRDERSRMTPDTVIDCHGHYTVLPKGHDAWREEQVAAFKAGTPCPPYPEITDDEIRETIEANQLRLIKERGADLTIFSPGPRRWRRMSATRRWRRSGRSGATI